MARATTRIKLLFVSVTKMLVAPSYSAMHVGLLKSAATPVRSAYPRAVPPAPPPPASVATDWLSRATVRRTLLYESATKSVVAELATPKG